MPHKQEDWPALTPQKLIQQKKSAGLPNGAPFMPIPNERYPSFSSVPLVAPTKEHKALITTKSARPIQRMEVPLIEPLEKSSIVDNVATIERATPPYNEADKKIAIIPGTPSTVNESTSHSDLSASAAAVEKSAYEAGSIGQPRQTRTSSLRARLSAGQLIKDSPITKPKVVGFTDFTICNESPAELSIQASRAPELKPNRSISPHSRQVYGAGLSKESLLGNRAPAQLVGGSQIPMLYHRSSRCSLRGERRAPSPFFVPQPAEQLVTSIPNVTEASRAATPPRFEARMVSESRRSSIPVFRHTVSSMLSQAENEKSTPGGSNNADPRATKNHLNEFGIFDSCASGTWPRVPMDLTTDPNIENRTGDFPECAPQQLAGLEAIEESPKQIFHLRRLSIASPELGPTLKIAKSADKVIMGSDSDKENQPESKLKKNTSNRHVAGKSKVQQNIQSLGSAKTLMKDKKRPSSSQGLQASSRTSSISKGVRERKVKSVDLSDSLSTDQLRPQSKKSKSPFPHINSKTSLMDDPFFDARSYYEQDKTASEVSTVLETKHINPNQSVDEEPWVSPIFYNDNHSSSSKADLVKAEKPEASDECLDEPSAEKFLPATLDIPCEGIETAQKPSKIHHNHKKAITVQSPSTPKKEFCQVGSCKSNSFPPRSSSHSTPPNYTANGSRKKSPISPLAIKNSEEFVARQNRLGYSKGFASAQLDYSDGSLKCGSAAEESFKSQGSIPKGMFSNLRDFFHKRNSDQGSLSSYRSHRKSKQNISVFANESPFPSTSEIHPIHRPTLCSMNRSITRIGKSALNYSIKTPTTPPFASPLPSEISTTTSLALELFESVRTESSSPKKERTLEMGTILVEAITQAREAEKAVEEARTAARRAETAHAMCKKTVADIASRVQEWKDEMDRM